MSGLRSGYIVLFMVTLAMPVLAQSPEAPSSADSEPAAEAPARPARRARQMPCWRQAGLSAEMVNKRWKIQEEAKGKIAAVCSEPSSSAQQKHEKIDQIHLEADQEIAHLIPAKELQAFSQCQAAQDQAKPHPAGQKELGPCGGVIPPDSASGGAEDHSHHPMK